jgi:hypothetical protein
MRHGRLDMVIRWVFVRNPISTEYILSHKKKKVHTIFYVLHKIFYFGEKMQKIIEYVKEKRSYVGAGKGGLCGRACGYAQQKIGLHKLKIMPFFGIM